MSVGDDLETIKSDSDDALGKHNLIPAPGHVSLLPPLKIRCRSNELRCSPVADGSKLTITKRSIARSVADCHLMI